LLPGDVDRVKLDEFSAQRGIVIDSELIGVCVDRQGNDVLGVRIDGPKVCVFVPFVFFSLVCFCLLTTQNSSWQWPSFPAQSQSQERG
jgi:hypothetical protein